MLTDRAKLLESLLEVNRLYNPDGQPVMFDLQIEAEILGCGLVWAEDAPPSVVSHPLANDLTIPTRLPEAHEGRLPLVLDVMRAMKAQVGEKTALYGLVTGPFTLASHLRGTDIFLDTVDNPEFLHDLLAYAAQVAVRVSSLYMEAGMDVIAVVDPVTSQVSPRMFANTCWSLSRRSSISSVTAARFRRSLCAVMPPRTSRACARAARTAWRWMRMWIWPPPRRSPIAMMSLWKAISAHHTHAAGFPAGQYEIRG